MEPFAFRWKPFWDPHDTTLTLVPLLTQLYSSVGQSRRKWGGVGRRGHGLCREEIRGVCQIYISVRNEPFGQPYQYTSVFLKCPTSYIILLRKKTLSFIWTNLKNLLTLKPIHFLDSDCTIFIIEKGILLFKPFQASQSWHQLSFYENKILVQNCLLNEWLLGTV